MNPLSSEDRADYLGYIEFYTERMSIARYGEAITYSLVQRGWLYASLSRFGEAMQDLDSALAHPEISAGNAEVAGWFKGLIMNRQGRIQEAASLFGLPSDSDLKSIDRAVELYGRAITLANDSRREEAIDFYDEVLEIPNLTRDILLGTLQAKSDALPVDDLFDEQLSNADRMLSVPNLTPGEQAYAIGCKVVPYLTIGEISKAFDCWNQILAIPNLPSRYRDKALDGIAFQARKADKSL